MNDYQLGVKLRRQILADFERGVVSDSRRTQALLSDFCGDSQILLLPALKHLVQTAAFQEAVSTSPPLQGETQLNLRLQQELDALFAPALCLRMAEALRGLLGMAPERQEGPIPTAVLQEARSDNDEPETEAELEAMAPASSSNSGVVALLSFIAGVLVVGVVGALTWLVLFNRGVFRQDNSVPAALMPTRSQSPMPLQPHHCGASSTNPSVQP